MNTNNRSWKPAIFTGIALFFVHMLGTFVFALMGTDVLQFMNVLGLLLGTITLLVGIWFAFKSVAVKIVLTIAALFLSAFMPIMGFALDAMFSTDWISLTVNGIGIVFLCPVALMLVVHYWPTKTAADETKKVTTPLESVPAPLTVPAEVISPAHIRFLERTNHMIELVLAGARLNDTSTPVPAFIWDDNEKALLLQMQIEERFAILFTTFNQGKGLSNDTDQVLPMLDEEEKTTE
jgi:hypothetical protein